MTHPLSTQNPSAAGARWNRLNGAFTELTFRIAEREVFFLRSANLVFLAGIAPQMAMSDSGGGLKHIMEILQYI
jgi:hypothetical protein